VTTEVPFEAVITQHGPTVLRVCRALLGPDDAEDAWSETFLSALRAYPELPGDANLEAWLVTIARHKAIDEHRRRSRRAVPTDTVDEVPAAVGPDPLDARELWAELARLPPRQREAVAYHYLGGLPYALAAQVLGTTEAAARRAAADGIARLRRTYRDPEREETP
jgi:RNA polymerase sigma factor (sigma-70 family)